MKRLKKRQIGRVVCTILQQLAITTPINVVYSWGITNKTATQIKVSMNGRKRFIAALMMEVYGFNYCGKLYITLNSVNGILHEENSDIPFGELGKVLDVIIETGGRSQQEHYQRLQEFLHGR